MRPRPHCVLLGIALASAVPLGCALMPFYGGSTAGGQARVFRRWNAMTTLETAGHADPLPFVAELLRGRLHAAMPTAIGPVIAEIVDDRCGGRRSGAEVALVVDASASMMYFRDDLRSAVPAMRAAAARGCRFSLTVYRDHGDAFVSRALVELDEPFERVASALYDFRAGGGGDWPEAVWEALDAVSAPLAAAGSRATILLVGDAPARNAPLLALEVQARLHRADLEVEVVSIARRERGAKAKGPLPKRGAAVTLESVARALGGVYRRVDRKGLGHELALALRAEAVSAPGGADVALVVDATGSMGRHIDFLGEEAPAVLEEVAADGTRVALVGYRDEADYWAARVFVPFGAPAALAEVLEHAGRRFPAGRGADDPEQALVGLRVATELDWRPGVPAVLLLVSDSRVHPHPASEAAVRAWLARPRTRLIVLEPMGSTRKRESPGARPPPASAPATVPASGPATEPAGARP